MHLSGSVITSQASLSPSETLCFRVAPEGQTLTQVASVQCMHWYLVKCHHSSSVDFTLSGSL